MRWQNRGWRQGIILGLGQRTGWFEENALEEALFWEKIQENRLTYFLRCFSGIDVYSVLLASGSWWWRGNVIGHWEMQKCQKKAADNPKVPVEGNTLICETEAIDHRRSGHQSYTMDRLNDGVELATLITQESKSVSGCSRRGSTGSFHCGRMETCKVHDELR